MNAQELRNQLEQLLNTTFHKLNPAQQMHVAGFITRLDDLCATERFINNAISNAAKELTELRSLIAIQEY